MQEERSERTSLTIFDILHGCVLTDSWLDV